MDEMPDLDTIISNQPMLGLAEEAVAELTGRSSKKWALLVVTFALGVAVAVFVVRRRASKGAPSIDSDASIGG